MQSCARNTLPLDPQHLPSVVGLARARGRPTRTLAARGAAGRRSGLRVCGCERACVYEAVLRWWESGGGGRHDDPGLGAEPVPEPGANAQLLQLLAGSCRET